MHAHIHNVCVCVFTCVHQQQKDKLWSHRADLLAQLTLLGKFTTTTSWFALVIVCVPVYVCIAFWFMDVSLSVCMCYIHVCCICFSVCVHALAHLYFSILGKNTLIMYSTATSHHVLKGQNITMLVFLFFPLQNTFLSHILVLYLIFVYNNWWDYRHFFLWSKSGQHVITILPMHD